MSSVDVLSHQTDAPQRCYSLEVPAAGLDSILDSMDLQTGFQVATQGAQAAWSKDVSAAPDLHFPTPRMPLQSSHRLTPPILLPGPPAFPPSW